MTQRNPRSTSGDAILAFKLLGRVTLDCWLIAPTPVLSAPDRWASFVNPWGNTGDLGRELLPFEIAGAGPSLEARGTGDLSEDRRLPPPPFGAH